MEKQAQNYVLNNIRQALTHANKNQLIGRIASFENETGLQLTLENFIIYHCLDLDDIYRKASWSRLCVLAGVRHDFHDSDEIILSKGLRRFCHNNSKPQLGKLLSALQDHNDAFLRALPVETKMLLTMFCFSIWNNKPPEKSLEKNVSRLKSNSVFFVRLLNLFLFLPENQNLLSIKWIYLLCVLFQFMPAIPVMKFYPG
ncbi:MAG: hypothetical protein K8S13_02705 [Desulfobacula sp.]|uniref:hypothetical protein n=1 Tax=Desulfobacula sp. TaxID=2593537 RepID=UPI0025C162AD|nr:hypothetical protein [Desulfobacula sp.]MCD4718755.1 hypothetical protein [Desulfobacula sp.]